MLQTSPIEAVKSSGGFLGFLKYLLRCRRTLRLSCCVFFVFQWNILGLLHSHCQRCFLQPFQNCLIVNSFESVGALFHVSNG